MGNNLPTFFTRDASNVKYISSGVMKKREKMSSLRSRECDNLHYSERSTVRDCWKMRSNNMHEESGWREVKIQ